MSSAVEFRHGLLAAYRDVYTPAARTALTALASLNRDRHRIMAARIARRREHALHGRRLAFCEPDALIPRTDLRVRDARQGHFTGSEIPADLRRQWIQGTGPATRPRASTESGLRNVAYALLSDAALSSRPVHRLAQPQTPTTTTSRRRNNASRASWTRSGETARV
jgi:malate synthase